MKLRTSLYAGFICLSVVGLAGRAWGQATTVTGTDVSVGYQALPYRTPPGPGAQNGLQLSDSALLHLGIGAEAGYDSNVFYSENNAKASPIIRILPFLELTNATRMGSHPSGASFDLGAALTYREYLSNDPLIRDQRAFMPSAFADLEFGGAQAVSFGVSDSFARTEDPPYLNGGSTQPFIRDTNLAIAQVGWAPSGGRLGFTLRYTNTIDNFETVNVSAASSMANSLMLDASWKWLPKTALFAQVSQGYISYLNTVDPNLKSVSYPLTANTGIRGLVTAKLAATLFVGYSNGFYATRPGPNGFRGFFNAGGDVAYRPTLLTTVALGYRHDFQNAILGDFYYRDAVYLNLGQAIAGRVAMGLSARYESRSFQGVPVTSGTGRTSRHDNFWQVGANLDYRMRAWTYVGVSYALMSNNSGYEPLAASDPGRVNYLKQQVFARLGVAY
jgi:hypothetical protein